MSAPMDFNLVARLADPADNVAIATRHLEAGTRIAHGQLLLILSHHVLEGHRFATRPIDAGDELLSWNLPFGLALRPISPGDYICNQTVLDALKIRNLPFSPPREPNFKNHSATHNFDPANFSPGNQVPPHPNPASFSGYLRTGDRGVGTRNNIAILGTTSQTGAYARALAERFKDTPTHFPNIDGVVPIAHTEGGGKSTPNNLDFLLRTLAGFIIHPNIGAVLIAGLHSTVVNNKLLRDFMLANGYPLQEVTHQFLDLTGSYQASLNAGAAVLNAWLPQVNACQRSLQPLQHLKIALQCGGSDAFSGVSGNPLAGWVAKELLRHGGSANLGETSELMGAERYILANVRNRETAQKFLQQIERFEQWANWHGHSAEGNPSGGNLYRGLYNITIKSIGAARKKAPQVRLDHAIDFAQLMRHPGYYFMDSPGNDLECIAGQVAAGCNIILFITGNGSVTNFPFVPTLKIVTTTGRYNLLRQEMDINAGRYLDGMPLEELGRESFDLTVQTASGKQSAGEKAGHSQVQLWREWRQTNASQLPQIRQRPKPDGQPLPLQSFSHPFPPVSLTKYMTPSGTAADQVGLILPTSLCSGQVARMIADRLNKTPTPGINRFVALAHTEGCGVSRGESERLFMRTLAGYLCHPFVRYGLLLEHGCEKTHNDEMRSFLQELHVDPARFGWASVQLDGGIDNVSNNVAHWFQQRLNGKRDNPSTHAGLDQLRLGILTQTSLSPALSIALASLAHTIAAAGGTVVVPEPSSLSPSIPFFRSVLLDPLIHPSLDYGERFSRPGLHVMHTPTDHDGETVAGLSATGVELILAAVTTNPLQNHPLVPLLQISPVPLEDVDLITDSPDPAPLLNLIARVTNRDYTPRLFALGNTDLQITRGLVGVSL